MQIGDTVRVLSATEDKDTIGVIRGAATTEIGQRAKVYRIVQFDDGHEGAYEDWELQVVAERT